MNYLLQLNHCLFAEPRLFYITERINVLWFRLQHIAILRKKSHSVPDFWETVLPFIRNVVVNSVSFGALSIHLWEVKKNYQIYITAYLNQQKNPLNWEHAYDSEKLIGNLFSEGNYSCCINLNPRSAVASNGPIHMLLHRSSYPMNPMNLRH